MTFPYMPIMFFKQTLLEYLLLELKRAVGPVAQLRGSARSLLAGDCEVGGSHPQLPPFPCVQGLL
jgi:hypothetical protein